MLAGWSVFSFSYLDFPLKKKKVFTIFILVIVFLQHNGAIVALSNLKQVCVVKDTYAFYTEYLAG